MAETPSTNIGTCKECGIKIVGKNDQTQKVLDELYDEKHAVQGVEPNPEK